MRKEPLPTEGSTHLRATRPLVAVDKSLNSKKPRSALSLGGFLTLAMENQMPYRAAASSFYRVSLSTELLKLEREPIWGRLAVALNLQLESARHEAGNASGREVERLREIPDYSLEPLNSLFLDDSSQVPVLKWDDDLLSEMKSKISRLGQEVIALHFRQAEPTATAFGLAFSEFVRQLMQENSLGSYSFIVLGDNIPNDLVGNPRVFFAKHEGWSLEQQLVASSQTACFIGEASGFCTAAIFSRAPYLIYKDPHQHTGTVDRDIGPGGKILFSNDSQLFLREVPTSENAATKILALIESSRVGLGQAGTDSGAERLP